MGDVILVLFQGLLHFLVVNAWRSLLIVVGFSVALVSFWAENQLWMGLGVFGGLAGFVALFFRKAA